MALKTLSRFLPLACALPNTMPADIGARGSVSDVYPGVPEEGSWGAYGSACTSTGSCVVVTDSEATTRANGERESE